MKKNFRNEETNKEWWIEIDVEGNLLRTCLNNNKVKETVFDREYMLLESKYSRIILTLKNY